MKLPDQRFQRRTFLKAAGFAAATPLLGGLTAEAAGAKTAPPYSDESKYTVCDMCFNRCGAIARVKDNRVVQLDPNPHFIKSRGMLCPRGAAGIAQLYDPDRIKQPLLRVGARGENKWRPLGWDEALDIAAAGLLEVAQKHTRCGVVFSVGADMQTQFAKRFAKAFGSWNVNSQESLCLFSMHRAYLDTFGDTPMPDIKNCRYVLMPGSNRFESLVTPDSSDLMEILQNGAKLAVVDPRYTKTAALATEWLQIKPGTDLALALAFIHVILRDNLYDAAWVAENTFGLEHLQAHVASCTPDWAEAETDIPAAAIERVAKEMAEAAPHSLVYPGRRTSDYTDSTQIRRGWCILNGLLGNFDRPGGLLATPILKMGAGIPMEAPWYDDTPKNRLDKDRSSYTFDEIAFSAARDAIIEQQPHSVGGWVVFKTNPMQTAPDRAKTMAMIDRLEFIVNIDIQMTDTAFMSDLILPAHTYLERQDPCQMLSAAGDGNCIVWREPVVPPLHDTKNPFDIFKGLAERMDLKQYFNFTVEEYRKKQLEGLPEAEEALNSLGVYHPANQQVTGLYAGKALKTSSKKVDLFSAKYEKKGLDPLPVYRRPGVEPEAFRLVAGRNALITQTSSQNNALLAEFVPTNTLQIHPVAAGKLGIQDGDMVEVTGNSVRERLRAQLDEGIRPDTVYMHSGFGSLSPGLSRVYKNGACIAALMHDAQDAISGNAAHHESFVTVAKAAGEGGV